MQLSADGGREPLKLIVFNIVEIGPALLCAKELNSVEFSVCDCFSLIDDASVFALELHVHLFFVTFQVFLLFLSLLVFNKFQLCLEARAKLVIFLIELAFSALP